MLGPEGVGIGYASPRALERMVPALEGWLSVERPFDFFDLDQPLKKTAARFEEGAHNVAGLFGFVESLRLLETYGTDALAQRILELTDLLADGLEDGTCSPRATAPARSPASCFVLAMASSPNGSSVGLPRRTWWLRSVGERCGFLPMPTTPRTRSPRCSTFSRGREQPFRS
jgi:selenocysteine lyase/cysteine desulfurase